MYHIAVNIDSKFVRHLVVMLISLFENNPSSHFIVHIVADKLGREDQDRLRRFIESNGQSVRFYFPPAAMLDGFSIQKFGKRISMATYYRCMLSSILPVDVERILYLDCDILVLADISSFYNLPFTAEDACACVKDIGFEETSRYERLHYPKTDFYFNAGVMLLNLKWWREYHVDEACMAYYRSYPDRILFNDQDLLNAVLHGHVKYVSECWNVQDGFYRRCSPVTVDISVLRHPGILHFTNRKPWNYDSTHPLRKLYFKYLSKTPWRAETHLNFNFLFKRFFRLLPYRLGMRPPKYIKL